MMDEHTALDTKHKTLTIYCPVFDQIKFIEEDVRTTVQYM